MPELTPKQQFLESYDREHAITMRTLRAYPEDRLTLQPHAKSKTARDLAWVFALERGLGTLVMHDGLASGPPAGGMPPAPESWTDLLNAIEKAHTDFSALIDTFSDEQLEETVKFMSGPGTMSDFRRIDFLWFLLSDEIHHRGQFSIYLRMADAKVPSIYGPTADEPWM
jgi:uncharacterized damage-inducible protein DinB